MPVCGSLWTINKQHYKKEVLVQRMLMMDPFALSPLFLIFSDVEILSQRGLIDSSICVI